jgi:hypothetical protein
MAKAGSNQPHSPAFDVEAYAAALVEAAPPLSQEQLDALGQIIRSVTSAAKPASPEQPRRPRDRQLALPYDQCHGVRRSHNPTASHH